MRKVLRQILIVFVLLAVFAGISEFRSFAASPAPQNLKLTIKTVIDNVNEHSGLANQIFTYSAARITEMNRTSTYPALYPSKKSTNTFQWRHGQTINVQWAKPGTGSNCDLIWIGPAINTDSHLSLASVEYSSADNLKSYTYGDNGAEAPLPVAGFNWLEVINSSKKQANVTLHFRYNSPIDEEPVSSISPEPEYSKTIDYLGDGILNPDTSVDGVNDYRLYLDFTTEESQDDIERDIIFVLDVSTSMEEPLGGTTRFNVLKRTVRDAIETLTENPRNNISIITFGTRAEIISEREKNRTKLRNQINNLQLPGGLMGGTNYYESMLLAGDIIDRNINNSEEKVVFFVSDGEPTAAQPAARALGYTVYSEVGAIYAFNAARRLGNVDKFYSIFIGSDSGNASTLQTVTQKVAVNDEKYMIQASSDEQLTNAFDRFVSKMSDSLYDVTIIDELTSYVDYTGGLKVTKSTDGEEPITLTAGIDYSIPSTTHDKVIIKFLKNTISNTKYSVSFNVRTNEEALDYYSEHKSYPDVGDKGTDYMGNNTSSGQPGFFSNSLAELRYSFGGSGSDVRIYDKPVVQVVEPDTIFQEIQLKKILKGKDLSEEMFTFEIRQIIYEDNGEISDKVLIDTVKNDGDGFINFDRICFNKPGQYVYEVREIVPGIPEPGIKYDTNILTVNANVTRDGDELVAKITYPDGNSFTNQYEPEPVFVNLQLKKEFLGKTLSPNDFQFRLFNGKGDSVETVSNLANGTIKFSPVLFKEEGSYKFFVREVVPMPANPNIIYDTKTVPITVDIADKGGYLAADVQYSGDNIFRNKFVYGPLNTDIEFKVILSGMQLSTGMFEFELVGDDGNRYTSVNQLNGTIKFPITFTDVGASSFTARQLMPDNPMRHMTYDEKLLEITVDVYDDGHGNLDISLTGNSGMTFYNSYKVRGGIW